MKKSLMNRQARFVRERPCMETGICAKCSFRQVSGAAAMSNKSFLGIKYRQLSDRMKAQKALVAMRKVFYIFSEYSQYTRGILTASPVIPWLLGLYK